MLQERDIHLINADIDGELAADERAELDRLLESSEEARGLQSDLRQLADRLASAPDLSPPTGLSDRILQRTRMIAPAPAVATHRSLREMFLPFRPGTAGVAFAAGLLLAIGYFGLLPSSSDIPGQAQDVSGMVGTMVAHPGAQAPASVSRLTIDEADISGTVSLQRNGDVLIVNLNLDAASRTEVEIGLAGAGLRFGGIARGVDGTAASESYEVSGGALRVVSQGRQVTSVFLLQDAAGTASPDNSGSGISIGILVRGTSVFSGVLNG